MARSKSVVKGKKTQGVKKGGIGKGGKTGYSKKSQKVLLKKSGNDSKKTKVKKDKTKLVTPTLERMFQMPVIEGEATGIDALTVMSPDVMLIATLTGELRCVNIKAAPKILSSYDLNDFCKILKLDSNRAVVYYPTDHHKIDIFTIQPELKIVKTIDYDDGYDHIAVTNDKNLISAKCYNSYTTVLNIFDTDGTVLRTFRPKLLRNIGLGNIKCLDVTSEDVVVVVDAHTSQVYGLPLDGSTGFVYSGVDTYTQPNQGDIDNNVFQTFHYHMQRPTTLTSDKYGNVYVGDKVAGLVTKLDERGNFVQNILPLSFEGNSLYANPIQILSDKRGCLFWFHGSDVRGQIHVYKM